MQSNLSENGIVWQIIEIMKHIYKKLKIIMEREMILYMLN